MEKRNITFSVKNVVSYLFGFVILGFAVVSLIRSDLGAGAWDTTTYNLRALLQQFIPFITLGMTSMIISGTIMITVLYYRKDWRLIFMIAPILLVAISIDFWDLIVYRDFEATLIQGIVLFIVGMFTLPLGLSLIVLSNFPAFVFDELMLLLMDVLHTKQLGKIRLGIELLGIVLAIIFGFIAGIGFGAVNIGSLFLAIVLGPIMAFYITRLKPLYQKY